MLTLNDALPKEMAVSQSKGINLAMLVLHAYTCLTSGKKMADLNPLAEIISQTRTASVSSPSSKLSPIFVFREIQARQELFGNGVYNILF